jgi:hypothetical protein
MDINNKICNSVGIHIGHYIMKISYNIYKVGEII